MDPIETWHDVPDFERMQKEIAYLTRKLIKQQDEIARLIIIALKAAEK